MWVNMGIIEFHGCLWEFVCVCGGFWEFRKMEKKNQYNIFKSYFTQAFLPVTYISISVK